MVTKAAAKSPVKTSPVKKTSAVKVAQARPGAATKSAAPKKAGAAKPVAPAPVPAKSVKAGNGGSGDSSSQAKAKPLAAAKEKPKKPKLVRDSFTMPEAEYKVLGEVKKACIKAGFEVKKSELLRIGVELIRQSNVAQLKTILGALPSLKAGRPKKGK